MTKIPLVDLRTQYRAHKSEFDAALGSCITNGNFIKGPEHEAFALEFAAFCGGGHVALCGNGTDALYLALMELLGRGDGDGEIITVSHTFIATAEAITLAGYKPVFVDIRPDTCLMDISLVEKAITSNTKALIPVHLYGQMVPMDYLMQIAQRHNLPVVEDAAQAHGATWMGKGPGQWGDVACFSFYPGKNLGAWGDGGAVFCRDQKLVERIRMRADHGRIAKYEHKFVGINSRLDGLQAAILRVKLRYLAEWNEKRRQVAAWYDELLSGLEGIQLPKITDGAVHVFHLYVIQVEERDKVLEHLRQRGIEAGIHYPIPLHEQIACRSFGIASGSLPITNIVSCRVISLPIYPEITLKQIESIGKLLRDYFQEKEMVVKI